MALGIVVRNFLSGFEVYMTCSWDFLFMYEKFGKVELLISLLLLTGEFRLF